MVHTSARSPVRSLSRFAAAVTVVLACVGSFSGIGWAATPGTRLWAERYNGSANTSDYARAVGVSPDGSTVYVTGSSVGSTSGPDYATVAYDSSTGATLWAKRYNDPQNLADAAYALAVSPDGSQVFVTGASPGSTGSYPDYATVAYDASTGSKLWVARYTGPGNRRDEAHAVGVSPDGSTVFVTGASSGSASVDYVTIAYDASTGTQLWVEPYNGPGDSTDWANALGVSPNGSNVFVTGYSAGLTGRDDFATVAYDASTGAQLWAKRYNGPGNGGDDAVALGVSPAGSSVFVTGASPGSTSGSDYATVAYDASTGAQSWTKRYNGSANGGDYAKALGVSPNGSKVFVTGYSAGSTSGDDGATLAYDASTGAKLWARRYNGTGNANDYPADLQVSPDGSAVFVTGLSTESTSGADYATVDYDASTGAKLWARLYDGPRNFTDQATALGVRPDGSAVFATGYSTGWKTGYDYATVAYNVA